MKLKDLFLCAMLLFGVVGLSSCEKSDEEKTKPELEKGTIAEIRAGSSKIKSYIFAGQLVNQVNHYNKQSGELDWFEKLERDTNGKLVKSTVFAGSNHNKLSEQFYTYSVSGNLESTASSYYSGGKLEFSTYTVYEYSKDNSLKKQTVFEGTEVIKNAKPRSFTTYDILPEGNYTQEKQFVVDAKGNSKLFSTTTYSYDTNYSPFFEVAEPGTASSLNNLIAASTVVHDTGKKYMYTYSYTYDQKGYPVSQSVTKPNGELEKYTYVYN